MDKTDIIRLASRISEGTATEQDIDRYNTWYNLAAKETEWDLEALGSAEAKSQSLMKGIQAEIQDNILVKRWAIIFRAAALVTAAAGVILSIGLFKMESLRTSTSEKSENLTSQSDIMQDRNAAVLTMSNGDTVQLSNGKLGVVVGDNLKYYDGSPLSYNAFGKLTASTSRGGTYQITLADGTKVWLNAASSIEFPASFEGLPNREVQLSGEAYFEVFKDTKQPFVLKIESSAGLPGQRITVLGTHFNVSAYPDEDEVRTTLLEGSVQVEGAINDYKLLKPNQQSILTLNHRLKVREVDGSQATGWKNNKFIFDSLHIKDIMRMLERWYDVEVIYTAEIPKDTFWGSVSKFDKISQVLKKLESTEKVHFRIEGRRIYVSP
jgi:ferric-dicitrate binding protein FerR (iron transport regulator)